MIKKTKIALSVATASLTLAGALVSPQAAALTQAEANAKKTAALESQVDQMATMMKAMQAELSRVKTIAANAADNSKVQELDQWMASVKNAPVQPLVKDHAFIVRGGWMRFNDNRDGTSAGGLGTLNSALGQGENFGSDRDAYYYGGAIDFNMNNDLFGMMDGVSFGIELGIEYAHLADKENNANSLNAVAGATVVNQTADVNQLRVSASPKIRFMHGSKLRPWIIPAGLDINIISPPSNAITVLNTGMQFGAGVDYELLSNVIVGVDGRYHHTFDNIDGVDTDAFTLGGNIGFKF
ncbi:MAG: porin family protein [Methylococcaceae bacterium]|nr:porin family protein [Methylococcaceae bacterium]